MELSIDFALPIGPFNNIINRACTDRFCHVELSLTIDCSVFRVLIDSCIEESYDPCMLQKILTRLKEYEGTVDISFYVLFGEFVTLRFLSDLNQDAFYRKPEPPIFESIKLNLQDIEIGYSVIKWNLKNLGRGYDIPRAVCLLLPFTMKTDKTVKPEKFFCSQLVMHMLVDCELFQTGQNIDHMTPDNVFTFLSTRI